MLSMRAFALVLFSTVLVACATAPRFQKLTPGEGQGVLYVYRQNLMTDRFLRANILAGGDSWFLGSGEYLAWVLPQGDYELKSSCPTGEDTDYDKDNCADHLNVHIISGEEHFVRFNPRAGKDIDASLSKVIGKASETAKGEAAQAAPPAKAGFLQYIARPQGRDEIQNLKVARP